MAGAKTAQLPGVADTVLQPEAADCRVPQRAAAERGRVATAGAKTALRPGAAAGTVPVQAERRRAGTVQPVAHSARKGWAKAAVPDGLPAACRLLEEAR